MTVLNLKANLASPTLTGTLTVTGSVNISSNLITSGYLAIGSTVQESALQVCSFREPIPTQFGIHIGTDSGTWDCGMNICSGFVANNTHIDFSYVGNTTSFNGQIGYDNTSNNMTFKTNKVNGMVLDSLGRLTLGSVTPSAVSTLFVSGHSYLKGNETLAGTLMVSGGSITGPTSITTSGTVTCYQVASTITKKIDIAHPTKEGYRLRHRCIEGPLGYLYDPYQYECVVGLNTFALPDYFTAMNSNVLVYVSPFKHFGIGWGETIF